MRALAALFEQSPDVTVGEPLYTLAEESHCSLAVGHTFGMLNEGGAFESVFVQMLLYGPSGFHGARALRARGPRSRTGALRRAPPRPAAHRAVVAVVKLGTLMLVDLGSFRGRRCRDRGGGALTHRIAAPSGPNT